MEDLFASLDPEKRDRIINAAIGEFAAFPYEKASTNSIVKKAGISKGLLFHYFSSKKALYEQLVGFVINKLYHAIADRIDWDEADLFERIRQIAIVKLEISRVYPDMFNFMLNMMAYKKPADVAGIIRLYKDYGLDIQQLMADIYTRNVDFSRFRNPETIAETVNIVRWTLEKYGEEQLFRLDAEAGMDFGALSAGLDRYMDILKRSFYHNPAPDRHQEAQAPEGGHGNDHC